MPFPLVVLGGFSVTAFSNLRSCQHNIFPDHLTYLVHVTVVYYLQGGYIQVIAVRCILGIGVVVGGLIFSYKLLVEYSPQKGYSSYSMLLKTELLYSHIKGSLG